MHPPLPSLKKVTPRFPNWSKDPRVSHTLDCGVQIAQEENYKIFSTVSSDWTTIQSLHFILSLAKSIPKLTIKIKSLISHRERWCKHNFAKYIYFWHLQSDVKAEARTYTYSDFMINAYFLNDIIQLMQR